MKSDAATSFRSGGTEGVPTADPPVDPRKRMAELGDATVPGAFAVVGEPEAAGRELVRRRGGLFARATLHSSGLTSPETLAAARAAAG